MGFTDICEANKLIWTMQALFSVVPFVLIPEVGL
jgi:hypothetical protein